MARIRAVLFDMDDTLIDWSGAQGDVTTIEIRHLKNVYDHLTRQNHKLPPFQDFFEQFRATMIAVWTEAKKDWSGVSFAGLLQTLFANCGLDVAQIDMEAVLCAYDWGVIPGVAPFEDTLTVLAQLKNEGYKTGLITNSMQPIWMREIELSAFGILDYLDARLTSGDVGYMKPHPVIYQRALELLDVAAEAAVFVGDRPENDIAGANQAGLTSVLISPPHLNRDLNGVEPHFTISKLEELLPILAQLEGES
ncbi:MAG: HAD family hydrolase [Ardenticatenaceae bacterium]|nr:HAD family hydrolase [Ardenticatenaceae bacterium]